jgi:cytoskeletal protein RodZ
MDEASLQVFAMSAFVLALIGIFNWIEYLQTRQETEESLTRCASSGAPRVELSDDR